jgi:hypothetical protein
MPLVPVNLMLSSGAISKALQPSHKTKPPAGCGPDAIKLFVGGCLLLVLLLALLRTAAAGWLLPALLRSWQLRWRPCTVAVRVFGWPAGGWLGCVH